MKIFQYILSVIAIVAISGTIAFMLVPHYDKVTVIWNARDLSFVKGPHDMCVGVDVMYYRGFPKFDFLSMGGVSRYTSFDGVSAMDKEMNRQADSIIDYCKQHKIAR